MAKDIKKIRAEGSTDEDLIEECKKEINCGECELDWNNNLPKGQQITPPSNTVAIVVDVVHNQGAVRIFEKDTGEYVNGVGTEEAGHRIILPWQASWRLRASGTIDVGYIKESQGGK